MSFLYARSKTDGSRQNLHPSLRTGFHASTENKQDLNKIEAFLDDNFNGFVNRYGDTVDAEFDSRWEYPEKAINELIALLAAKDKIYIRILTYELEDEYVSFRIFSQGKWDIKL